MPFIDEQLAHLFDSDGLLAIKNSLNTMDDKARILAVNSYTITSIDDTQEAGMADDSIMRDLIDSGQAVEKITH